MMMLRFIRYISAMCIFITLLSYPTTAFAKRISVALYQPLVRMDKLWPFYRVQVTWLPQIPIT